MTAMAEPPAHDALDVRAFLLGDDGTATLRERLDEVFTQHGGALGALGGPVRRVVAEEVADVAAGFLDIDLGATALAGWRRHRQLQEAARATVVEPGLVQRVGLASHTMTSTWRPGVELHQGATRLAHLTLEVKVSFTIVGLDATVTAGRLTRLGGGDGTVSATLSLGGHPLLTRTEKFDAHTSVPLGSGIPLLATTEDAATTDDEAPSVVESPRQPSGSP